MSTFSEEKETARHALLCSEARYEKANDRVEWDYLRAIMTQLGFHRIWVDMVLQLITTVSFSVLFNGERLRSFSPTRGDPLGLSYFSQFVSFGSRGPFVPLKFKTTIIDSQWYQGGAIGSGGKPSSLR
jgi:hypothetical protein